MTKTVEWLPYTKTTIFFSQGSLVSYKAMSLLIAFSLQLVWAISTAQLICEEGYSCYEDPTRNVVWVKKDAGNIWGPTCQEVCEDSLLNNAGVFHSCDYTQPAIYDKQSFSNISEAFNFTCGNGCWGSKTGNGLILVTNGDSYNKNCYFPEYDPNVNLTLACHSSPGNANCYGERFSTICPCVAKPLIEACYWEEPKNKPAIPTFHTSDRENSSCLNRVNYWRKKACDDGWIECPPSGLPPMTECICCNECGNSEAEYDKNQGAHASFKRCGERVQGEGGGPSCATVIDAFVSERSPDANGTMRCQGHCGPIVAQGCQTFFWGQYNGFYTLNWRSCNVDTCNGYCNNPSSNECFESPVDIAPDISECPTLAPTMQPTDQPSLEPTGSPTLEPTDTPTSSSPTSASPTSVIVTEYITEDNTEHTIFSSEIENSLDGVVGDGDQSETLLFACNIAFVLVIYIVML